LVTIKAMQKQISEVRHGFISLKQTEQRKEPEDGSQGRVTNGLCESSVQSLEQTEMDSGDSASQKTETGGSCQSEDCHVAAGAAAGLSCMGRLAWVAPAVHSCRRCRPLAVQHAEATPTRKPRVTRSPLPPRTGIDLWAPTSAVVGPRVPSPNSPCRPVAAPVQCASVAGTPREPRAVYAGGIHLCLSRSPSPPYRGIPTTPRTPVASKARTSSRNPGSQTTPSVSIQAPPRNVFQAVKAVSALPRARGHVSPPGSPGCWTLKRRVAGVLETWACPATRTELRQFVV